MTDEELETNARKLANEMRERENGGDASCHPTSKEVSQRVTSNTAPTFDPEARCEAAAPVAVEVKVKGGQVIFREEMDLSGGEEAGDVADVRQQLEEEKENCYNWMRAVAMGEAKRCSEPDTKRLDWLEQGFGNQDKAIALSIAKKINLRAAIDEQMNLPTREKGG